MDLQNTKVAEVQLSYKTTVKASERPQINTSNDVYRVLKENCNYEVIEFIEEFEVLLLNQLTELLELYLSQ